MSTEPESVCKYCGKNIIYSQMRGWVHKVPLQKNYFVRQKFVEGCNNPEPRAGS